MPSTRWPTAADRIKTAGGPTAGFDYLRLGLAISILCWHTIVTCYGLPAEAAIWAPPLKGFISLLLPMFFALSGFLVSGSLARAKSVVPFVALRALRIVPALFVEVTLCALILGPLVTEVPLSDYYQDSSFWLYFRNVVGIINFKLPGVFSHNPYNQAVNVSLWTIPYELECYVVLTVLGLTTIFRNRIALLVCVILGHIAVFALDARHGFAMPLGGSVPPRIMVMCFLSGVTLFQFRDKVPCSGALAALALAAAVIGLNWNISTYITPPLVAYATMVIGLTHPKRAPIIFKGDYSYGLYLYAFPMQQTFAFLFPGMRFWWASILFSLPATALFAAFSWHMIERRALKLKKYVGNDGFSLQRFREWTFKRPAADGPER